MYTHEDILRKLPPEDAKELALWEALFESPGYALQKQVVVEQLEAALSVLANAPSWETYQYARGARDALNVVFNLEATVQYKVQEKLQELEEAAANEPVEDFT
jgi:hypothetical protein